LSASTLGHENVKQREEETEMAELTKLESKLGEVTGLAMAAQVATEKVRAMTQSEDDALATRLQQMHAEAEETEKRCVALAGELNGKKTAILEEARQTKSKAAEMMKTYLDRDSEALDGFEFLTMAEAGEVGHWSILKTLTETAGDSDVATLVEWALPIQERHFADVKSGSLKLAGSEDPNDPA
jgi:hypothetical protein